jgi:hypothetical protein
LELLGGLGRLSRDHDVLSCLDHFRYLVTEFNLHIGERAEFFQEQPRQRVLVDLESEGVAYVVFQDTEVEFSDEALPDASSSSISSVGG